LVDVATNAVILKNNPFFVVDKIAAWMKLLNAALLFLTFPSTNSLTAVFNSSEYFIEFG
jgi:hypothetical protein